MYSKLRKLVRLLLCYSITFPIQAAEQANTNEKLSMEVNIQPHFEFKALPEQCVTLRQGRDCFAKINMHWQSNSKKTLCLYQKGLEQHIKCWHNIDSATITIEFISNKSTSYQLRRLSDNKLIAETQVKVSWLHKSSARKRRWRLF
jgi:hypothetical protein